MEKEQLLEKVEYYKNRLFSDVQCELEKEYNMGQARWDSWCISVLQFFESNLPSYLRKLKNNIDAPPQRLIGYTANEILVISKILPMEAFLKSLIQDIKADDYLHSFAGTVKNAKHNQIFDRKAFIVHGHDEATKWRTARVLEKLGFEAIILHEQASSGRTIIEKLEDFTDVGFGIVLYTPDDVGEAVANRADLKPRARQNVVFEHGLLIGKLTRERVFPLVTDHNVELPGDISGMVYLSDNGWEFQLAKEIKALGYEIDLNKLS